MSCVPCQPSRRHSCTGVDPPPHTHTSVFPLVVAKGVHERGGVKIFPDEGPASCPHLVHLVLRLGGPCLRAARGRTAFVEVEHLVSMDLEHRQIPKVKVPARCIATHVVASASVCLQVSSDEPPSMCGSKVTVKAKSLPVGRAVWKDASREDSLGASHSGLAAVLGVGLEAGDVDRAWHEGGEFNVQCTTL